MARKRSKKLRAKARKATKAAKRIGRKVWARVRGSVPLPGTGSTGPRKPGKGH